MTPADLRAALLTLLDHVDYESGACLPNEPIGAVLPPEALARTKEALLARAEELTCSCHSCEVLPQLHNQIAEMCEYLGVDPKERPADSWTLRDELIKLKPVKTEELEQSARRRLGEWFAYCPGRRWWRVMSGGVRLQDEFGNIFAGDDANELRAISAALDAAERSRDGE